MALEISDREAENYKTILESIGYSTKLGSFSVDSRGYSPELGSELGDDYLDNRVIIASEKQLKEISIEQKNTPYYMFQIVSHISKELVKSITPYHAMTGCVNLIYGSDSLISIFDKDFENSDSQYTALYASLVLDTLEGDIKKICSSQENINKLTKSLKNLDNNLLENILTETHPLTSKYGSIREINARTTNVNIDLSEMKKIFQFRHKSRDITVFNCKTPFLIYTGEKNIADNKPVKILHESEKGAIIDYKVKNQLLEVEKETVAAMMESTARSILNSKNHGRTKLTGFQFYKEFNKLKESSEITEDLKKAGWHLLRDFYFDRIEFNTLPLELKKKVVVVKKSERERSIDNA